MNRLMRTVAAFVAALAMIAAPVAEAQSRGRQSHTSGAAASQNAGKRPGSSANGATRPNRPSHGNNNSPSRPSTPPSGSNSRPTKPGNDRPGSGSNHNRPTKPGNDRPGSGSNHNRPTKPGNNRPGCGSNHNRPTKPGNNRPGHTVGPNDYRPGRPGHGGHRPPVHARPPRIPHGYRHPVPFFGAYHRPVPPPSWNRYYAGPTFGTILGVALGTTLDLSIRSLINSGYAVTNYGSNVVYLTNVPQMNLMWPNAAMYYNNGLLCGSQFTYPSPYYDMQRYNLLYNQLVGQYGVPIEQYNSGGVISATWFGAGNRFVTLEFNNTGGQYYTTLSFGN